MKDDVTIVLCGAAGDGIETAEKILCDAITQAGYFVYTAIEVMSRVRGGSNSTLIRVSSKPVSAYSERIDFLFAFDKFAVPHLKKRILKDTIIVGEKENFIGYDGVDVRLTDISRQQGVPKNIVAVGAIYAMLGIDQTALKKHITAQFIKKGEEIVEKNIAASLQGYEKGKEIDNIKLKKTKISGKLMDGSEAIAYGAIAGGCNFICAYPMSPSTGVLTLLAKNAKEYGIIVEQAEDEIAGINMALGAWYTGARALANSSGGGFALMEEAVSLCGMIETPVVIHIAQRPGPATGLPTRTGQEDLNLALYSGHGEFPRIIFTPGNNEEGFKLTKLAFDLADKYQIPVFILTEQHYTDSTIITKIDAKQELPQRYVIKTSEDYKRYKLTESGISPRGIPSFGKGLVGVDSDEHDEEAHITEDHDIRDSMVEKRLKKSESIIKEAIAPTLYGAINYKRLLVTWGANFESAKEAIDIAANDDIALLHFSQVYPLHPDTIEYLKKAKKTAVLENNATGQFARLIKSETGFGVDKKLLKYNGLPFSVEEITDAIKSWRE
ncbi:MAG: 2-oxoacid:acceptor oxidoreductase subunit alpha [archaeon]